MNVKEYSEQLLKEAVKNGTGIINDHTGTLGRHDYNPKQDALHKDAIKFLVMNKYVEKQDNTIYKATTLGWKKAEELK